MGGVSSNEICDDITAHVEHLADEFDRRNQIDDVDPDFAPPHFREDEPRMAAALAKALSSYTFTIDEGKTILDGLQQRFATLSDAIWEKLASKLAELGTD